MVSVDTKKKELISPYAKRRPGVAPGRLARGGQDPRLPDAELGKAIPYGIYDLAANTGLVNVGTDHDTAAFAVASLRRWWNGQGRTGYPGARRLLITADVGGSNSYPGAGKTELAAFAAETGLRITVCPYPPGTSKWNKVEHRLFSHITMNWRGRPLTSHQVAVNTIAATTTRTGLRVQAELDPGSYPTGVTISDEQLAHVPITRHDWHAEWNYTVHPTPTESADYGDSGHPPATRQAQTDAQEQADAPSRGQLFPCVLALCGVGTALGTSLLAATPPFRQPTRAVIGDWLIHTTTVTAQGSHSPA